jgi:hypothetical protein
MRRFVSVGLASVAAFVGLGVAAEGSSQRAMPLKITVAKDPDGPYKSFLESTTLAEGQAKTFFFKVGNRAAETDGVRLRDQSSGSGDGLYKLRWFKGKGVDPAKEITEDLEGDGFFYDAPPESKRSFTVKVKLLSSGDPNNDTLCLRGEVISLNENDFDQSGVDLNGQCI